MTTSPAIVDSLSQLQPEASGHQSRFITILDELDGFRLFKYKEKRVPETIACSPPLIASLNEDLVPRLPAGGRLPCARAGNSGLLGFIDYNKLPAILSFQGDRVFAFITPDSNANIKAQDAAEAFKPGCSTQPEKLPISSNGTVLGIPSLGHIVFVLRVPQVHSRQYAVAAWIILEGLPVAIGSPRATHFIRILQEKGHVFRDTIHHPYSIGDSNLNFLIEKCRGNVKLACAAIVSGLPLDLVKRRLDLVSGNFHPFVDFLRLAIKDQSRTCYGYSCGDLFLAIDGGGTKCAVSIANRTGIVARAHAGAGNFHSVPIDVILNNINSAVMKAISLIPKGSRPQPPLERPQFAAVWAGLAGLQHAHRRECLARSLEQLFGVSVEEGTLRLSSDSELLSAHIGLDHSVTHGISLIAGTGSVATAFRKDPIGNVLHIGRAGGWGSLLGDQGSAFDIGKQAVQALLTSLESSQGTETECLSELEREVLASLGDCKEGLLSRILFPETEMKKTIAGLARVVTKRGFRTINPDPQALGILTSAARSLVQIVRPLVKKQICDPSTSSLVLSGALMKIPDFQSLFLSELSREGIGSFRNMVIVDDASSDAVLFLARQASRTS